MVWKQKNNKIALIKFKNTVNSEKILANMTTELSLFDVMTNIS